MSWPRVAGGVAAAVAVLALTIPTPAAPREGASGQSVLAAPTGTVEGPTSGPGARVLAGHSGDVYGLAFSPDGRLLASASADMTVRLWRTRTWRPRRAPLRGHTSIVSAVAFSPDGRIIATAGWDKTVRLWWTRTGRPRGAPLRGHTGVVSSVAFSPDGRTVASGGWDGTVRLWNVRAGRQRGAPLRGRADVYNGRLCDLRDVTGVAFSPDGRTVVSSGRDCVVRRWDVRTHREDRRSRQDGERGFPLVSPHDALNVEVWGVAFSPDGGLLASVDAFGSVRVWDVGGRGWRAVPRPRDGHRGDTIAMEPAIGVAFHPAGGMVASAGRDGTVRLWNALTGRERGAPLRGHQGWVRAVAFGPGGRVLASAGDDNTIRLWRPRTTG